MLHERYTTRTYWKCCNVWYPVPKRFDKDNYASLRDFVRVYNFSHIADEKGRHRALWSMLRKASQGNKIGGLEDIDARIMCAQIQDKTTFNRITMHAAWLSYGQP